MFDRDVYIDLCDAFPYSFDIHPMDYHLELDDNYEEDQENIHLNNDEDRYNYHG